MRGTETLLRSAGVILSFWLAAMPMTASELTSQYPTVFSCADSPGAAGPRHFRGVLAGVPAIVRVPPRIEKPPILLWHGFGAPGSEAELMEALPLDDVPA
ncbi:MAG TPA: hypothetical protein VGI35_05470, partial [Steroidobacteraceae bacterium]